MKELARTPSLVTSYVELINKANLMRKGLNHGTKKMSFICFVTGRFVWVPLPLGFHSSIKTSKRMMEETNFGFQVKLCRIEADFSSSMSTWTATVGPFSKWSISKRSQKNKNYSLNRNVCQTLLLRHNGNLLNLEYSITL